MAIYSEYFDLFPKIKYDINRQQYPTYESATNIFFRLGVIREVLNNTSSYYVYDIEGKDTPEIVAEKVYGDAGAGWIILYANQIIDPQFEWVLDDTAFNKYLVQKYGSIANAEITVHHYEKVIERTVDGITTTFVYRIDEERLTDNALTVPFDSFSDYLAFYTIDTDETLIDNTVITTDITRQTIDLLPVDQYDSQKTFETYNNVSGKTVTELTYARAITNYAYESELNDSRRQIKVIKSDYYPIILEQFKNITNQSEPFLRRVF